MTKNLPNTEKQRRAPFRAVGKGVVSPKGLGTDGYKPLMRNRAGQCLALRDRVTARNIFSVGDCVNRSVFICASRCQPNPVSFGCRGDLPPLHGWLGYSLNSQVTETLGGYVAAVNFRLGKGGHSHRRPAPHKHTQAEHTKCPSGFISHSLPTTINH